MRKPPIEHVVHSHIRETPKGFKTSVRKYHRGKGKPETPRLFGHKDDSKSHGGFDVTLRYEDNTSERGVVKSPDYLSALPKSLGFAKKEVRSITLRKMEPWTAEVK